MHGQRIGYVRVSSFEQHPDRQLEQVEVDKVFTDTASGKDTQRPVLEALLAFAREGDTVVVVGLQWAQAAQGRQRHVSVDTLGAPVRARRCSRW